MKKKLFISTLAVVFILSMSVAMFAGCNGKAPEFGEQTLGATKPTNVDTVASFTEGMSAFEMLEVGMANYYNTEYVASFYNGSVKTKVMGMTVTQLVESLKIRNGVGDPTGFAESDAEYFADSRSTGFTDIYEKMIITPDGVKYKTADSGIKVDKETGEWSAKKWKAEEPFTTVQGLAESKDNNPTILWMYDLQEQYVLKAGEKHPVNKDDDVQTTGVAIDENGVYTFTLDFDPIKTTESYIETMKAQLEGNAGMKVSGLQFKTLLVKVEMWDNGLIKRIFVTESYKMKLAGVINSVITLYSDTQFTYEEVDGYKLADHVSKF